jgi:hypothetical protein
LILAGCAAARRQAVRDRLPRVPEPDRPLASSLSDADLIVAGQLVAVEEADAYEPFGGFTFGPPGAKVVVPMAYNGELRVDSTLYGAARGTLRITFFAPRGTRGPGTGTTAVWVLHRRTLWRLRQCRERQALTSTACPYDLGWALDSDEDIRRLEEWPRLRSILETLGLAPQAPTE